MGRIPDKIDKLLKENDCIKQLARTYTYATNFLYLGRGWNYPVALEGALKLKEISYIHAEGYPAAEMKHGPIALVDNMMPVLFVATHHEGYEKVVSNMQEVKARGGRIIAVITEGDTEVQKIADEVINVPPTLAPLALRRHRDPLAVARLSHCRGEGTERRPAAQPRQECDGGVGQRTRSHALLCFLIKAI